MQTGQQGLWKNRLERLKDDNRSLREKLSTLRKEYDEFRKVLKNNQKLFHSVPAGIVLVQKGKIIEINEIALAQLGWKAEEAINRDFLDFVHPDSKKFVRNLHTKRVSGKGLPTQYETDLITKNGASMSFDVRVKRIRFDGRTALVLSLTSIEERRQREEERMQSKKMEAIATLASGLNRELVGPITDIRNHIVRIQDVEESDHKTVAGGLREIESATSQIINSAQRLDSLARTKVDPSDIFPFDLKKVVKDAVSLINPTLQDLEAKGDVRINLRTYLRSVSPVEGNPDEIQDVIVHLILNAVEAMPGGGELYVTIEENAGYAHIYVQDSGVGIPENIKERVLEPFFTTKGRAGAGLGLSLSYAILKRHQGEIEVSSQKDHGTIFTVRLPLASQKQKPKPKVVKKKIKNAQILIIANEDIVRQLLSQLLMSKGHKVVTALSGAEGLNKLKKKKFDLVIADSGAPDIKGQIFVQELKKLNGELPISLITEHEWGNQFTDLVGSDVDLIINKPIDMNKVAKQVSNVLTLRADQS